MLDEISEMRLDLQAKLLRAIQEQEFERVGGNQPVRVDVRIVATTNRDLEDEVRAGRFRSDLYYRLHVIPVHAPALRERLEDLPLLVEHFVRASAAELGIPAPHVGEEALEQLARRPWPGNVRELANAVERAVILARGGRLGPDAFGFDRPRLALVPRPEPAHRHGTAPEDAMRHENGAAPRRPLPEDLLVTPPADVATPSRSESGEAPAVLAARPILNLRELERVTIERALATTGGHRTRAAELLGISERTLRNKLNGGSREEAA